jgi:hypothetical protein
MLTKKAEELIERLAREETKLTVPRGGRRFLRWKRGAEVKVAKALDEMTAEDREELAIEAMVLRVKAELRKRGMPRR